MSGFSEYLVDMASVLTLTVLFDEAGVCGLSGLLVVEYVLVLLWVMGWSYVCGHTRGMKR